MRGFLILLFCLIAYSSISQSDVKEKYKLMPWPLDLKESNSNFKIDESLSISIKGVDSQQRVSKASVRFLRRLANRTGVFIDKGFAENKQSSSIEIDFDSLSNLNYEDDESYELIVNSDKILIKAITDVGALRALETLLQLVDFNETGYYFGGVIIEDAPRFVWRGLMIDVARHFQPIDVLKRNLDAMASVKLNVFHWHLTDDQGVRVESKIYPNLQKQASDGLYYTQEQIKELVDYASSLGIRVVPEFDVPGHASAILTAYPQLGSKKDYNYSIERFAGVFDPTLDPTNDDTYEFLDKLFTEMTSLFPDKYFHIGGDENEGKHWDQNIEITKFKQKHNLENNHELQTYFNIKLEKILNRLGKSLMGWDEIMTEDMPTTAVIHSWRGENEGLPKGGSLIKAAKMGYKTVLSNGFYIDRMLSVEHHYSIEPIGDVKLTEEERARILGGEATMWSELVTPLTIDSRIWPRTAAIAERLWSSKEVNDIDNMKLRLKEVSFKLEELGITHIGNRDVILRSMSNTENIEALITLSKVCEPLKIYSRNKGGTEYKTFSPFTLFADACVVDAKDAILFKKTIAKFNNSPDGINMDSVKTQLMKWSNNHDELLQISDNPNVKPLIPLSQNLFSVSKRLLRILNDKEMTKKDVEAFSLSMNTLDEPFVDVELVIIDDLNKLITYCKTYYLTQ